MLNDVHNNARRGGQHRRLFPRFSPTATWADTFSPTVPPTDSPKPPGDSPAQQPPPQNQLPPNQQNPQGNGNDQPDQSQPTPPSNQNPPPNQNTPSDQPPSTASASSTPSTSPSSSNSSSPSTDPGTPSQTPSPDQGQGQSQNQNQQQGQNQNSNPVQNNSQNQVPPPTQVPNSSPTPTVTGGRGGSIASPVAPSTPSATAVPSGGVSTAVVIGGVVAGLVGVVGIVFAVLYFLRRQRDNNDEHAEEFQPDNFRRQSVLLPDADGNPSSRSLTMRQTETTAYSASFAQNQPPYAQHSYQDSPLSPQFSNGAYYGYEAQAQPSFAPGQFVPMGHQLVVNTSAPPPPSTSNPFFSPIGESPMSPYSAPDSAQTENATLIRKPSATMNAYVTRQTAGSQGGFIPPDADYVDLSRSSVTPFQAAQYAEISRRLNTTPPGPMPTPVLATVAENMESEPPVPPKTVNTPPLDVGQNVAVGHLAANVHNDQSLPESPFADPEHTRTSAVDPDEIEMPQPPSPAFSSNSRVNSTPPVLPEISVAQRSFSPVTYEAPLGVLPGHLAPLPLASHMTLPAEAHYAPHHGALADVPKTPTVESPPVTPRPNIAEAKRPETLYDDDDAYAGI